MQSHYELLEDYPEFRYNLSTLESYTRSFQSSGGAYLKADILTIRTVVHVVYRTEDENITDQQVASQIDVLNRDFQASNSDITKVPEPFRNFVGNAQIQFQLARQDPNGRPTDGISRTRTTVTEFLSSRNQVKFARLGGADAWDTRQYMNIWVCSLGDNLLGYAQFPGGPVATDGVVVLNTAFGTSGIASPPFNLGRTATHEVGHYLNLAHIFGDSRVPNCTDTDFVPDTPNQFGPNFHAPTFPTVSCNNGPNGDMFMNYMDYVNDASMYMFTLDQVVRMKAALTSVRRGILSQ